MNATKTLVAAAIALTSFAASAQVTGSLGRLSPSFLSLSSTNLSGGAIYTASQSLSHAIRPSNSDPVITTVGNWGAVGGSSNTNNGGGSTSTLTLASGVTGVSFLWGSADTFNSVRVNTNAGSQTFTAAALGLTTPNGAGYVNFRVSGAASAISSLNFMSSQTAFEFSNVSAVPEPGTYAMLLSGLMAVGFVARRRRAQSEGQLSVALR